MSPYDWQSDPDGSEQGAVTTEGRATMASEEGSAGVLKRTTELKPGDRINQGEFTEQVQSVRDEGRDMCRVSVSRIFHDGSKEVDAFFYAGKLARHRVLPWNYSTGQQACEKCAETYGYHAHLHAGHIWTEISCPAYRTLNGDDCICGQGS